MRQLSTPTKLYLIGIIAVGGGLLIWQLIQLPFAEIGLLVGVGVLAALAQIIKVEGPTERSSYNISWVGYGFAFVLLGVPGAMFVILLAHLADWVKHRYAWYIQSFNIAQFAIAATCAMLVRTVVQSVMASPLTEALAIVSASVAFTGLNHLLIGIALKLARGQSFKESGVFERLTLAIDFTLFSMGVAGAFVSQVNPFAAFLAAVPLYLIYITLRVPALQRQTQIDPKTGLYNSKYFTQALETELARSERYDRPLTVVMADLDLLRNINNTYGHLAGDVCLMAVANILRKSLRDYDVVARFGGEEFAILMPETTHAQAQPRIEAIRAAIEATRIEVSTSITPLQVTMSFGIAERDRFGQTLEDIVHGADLAVYQAKLSGRNRICRYTSDETRPVTAIPPQTPPAPAAKPAPPTASVAAPAVPPSPAPSLSPEPATPKLQPRPRWMLKLYIAILAVMAVGLSLPMLSSTAQPEWLGLALFMTLAILAEGLAIDIYAHNTSISTATAPMIAGTLLFGPVGAVGMGLAVAVTSWVKHRSSLSKFIFNAANHTLACLLSLGMFRLVRLLAGGLENQGVQIASAILAGGVMYLSSTALLALVIDISTGEPFRHVWAERFHWLWPYYLALGALASVLASAFVFGGWVSVLVALVPLLLLRYSQVQYINHTKDMVAELRATNFNLLQHTEQISALNEELLLTLSQASDVRDPDVVGHSANVARYAVLIAQQLGLPAERIELVRKAGLLHDIGKLGIPEAILFKPAQLTEAEYHIVQHHSELGAEIVGNAASLKVLAPLIRHHHERFDGRGYPAQISGHAIPLESRILSVADTVEAMASDRPYRPGVRPEAILQELMAHAGSQFDPEVVAAFVNVIRRDGKTVIVNSARNVTQPAPFDEPASSERKVREDERPTDARPNPKEARPALAPAQLGGLLNLAEF